MASPLDFGEENRILREETMSLDAGEDESPHESSLLASDLSGHLLQLAYLESEPREPFPQLDVNDLICDPKFNDAASAAVTLPTKSVDVRSTGPLSTNASQSFTADYLAVGKIESSSNALSKQPSLMSSGDLFGTIGEASAAMLDNSAEGDAQGAPAETCIGDVTCALDFTKGRSRKTPKQVRQLEELFARTKGQVKKCDKSRLCREIGLNWIQIYKWIFDRQQKRAAIEQERIDMFGSRDIFLVTRKGRVIQPKPIMLFKTEKVIRKH